MINTPKYIIFTRKIDPENKKMALDNAVNIDDVEFLTIQYLCTDELLRVVSDPSLKIVFTSMHAVKSVYDCLLNNNLTSTKINCYAIEGRTSNLVIEYGFTIINTAVDGKSLAKAIIENGETSVIHFTTVDSRKEIKEALTKHSIDYQKILVYEKTVNSITVSKPFDGIVFFSPSQIEGFLKSNKLGADIPAFCIGETTKNHLKNYDHQNIHVAESAAELALIKKVISYFNNNNTI